jgi:hypothetical protein
MKDSGRQLVAGPSALGPGGAFQRVRALWTGGSRLAFTRRRRNAGDCLDSDGQPPPIFSITVGVWILGADIRASCPRIFLAEYGAAFSCYEHTRGWQPLPHVDVYRTRRATCHSARAAIPRIQSSALLARSWSRTSLRLACSCSCRALRRSCRFSSWITVIPAKTGG